MSFENPDNNVKDSDSEVNCKIKAEVSKNTNDVFEFENYQINQFEQVHDKNDVFENHIQTHKEVNDKKDVFEKLLLTKDHEERKRLIYKYGYSHFTVWFHENSFFNYWQLFNDMRFIRGLYRKIVETMTVNTLEFRSILNVNDT